MIIQVREVGLTGGKSKAALRVEARRLGGDTTHLGDPPATYPTGAHEGDKVSVRANLCCTADPLTDCEGYVKFIVDGVEYRIPETAPYYDIPRNSCRWSPAHSFTMPAHDVIVTIEPWESDVWPNPDDKGDSADIVIKYVAPDEPLPSRDPLDTLILWVESVRPKAPGPLESVVSGTANLIIRITPPIPILPS